MIIPRRVRRRLLLPPGWVALGFLLLLGCLALQPWKRQLRKMNVLQLTIPKLKLNSTDIKLYGREYQIVYKPLTELTKFRPWHDVEFKGEKSSDSLAAAITESAIRQIIADTGYTGGVRVRFLPSATYANLVKVLDIMLYTDQKKYWLDIQHQPTTLYAITMRQERRKNIKAPVYLGCCTCGPYRPEVKAEAVWLMKIQALWAKPWRPTAILLALIGTLGLWPLFSRRIVSTLNH